MKKLLSTAWEKEGDLFAAFGIDMRGFFKVLTVLAALSSINNIKADCTSQKSEGCICLFLTFNNSFY